MITILKDGELNYDFNVWFLKKKKKKNAQQSQIRFNFFFIIYFSSSAVYFYQCVYQIECLQCQVPSREGLYEWDMLPTKI